VASARHGVSGARLVCAPAAWGAAGTYKVGVGGLLELLLGAVADVRICGSQSVRAARAGSTWRGQRTGRESPLQHLVDIHDCRRVR
jgi:hypothetical protein